MNNTEPYIQPAGPATNIEIHPDARAYLQQSGDKYHASHTHQSTQTIPTEYRPTVIDHSSLPTTTSGEGVITPQKPYPAQNISIPPASGVDHLLYGFTHWLGNKFLNNSDAWKNMRGSRIKQQHHQPIPSGA